MLHFYNYTYQFVNSINVCHKISEALGIEIIRDCCIVAQLKLTLNYFNRTGWKHVSSGAGKTH